MKKIPFLLEKYKRFFLLVNVFLFDNVNVLLKAPFACMNTTTVNSCERGGLKLYFKHSVPMDFWVGCEKHKLALCLKHLLKEFQSVADLYTLLLFLWNFSTTNLWLWIFCKKWLFTMKATTLPSGWLIGEPGKPYKKTISDKLVLFCFVLICKVNQKQ